MEPDEEHIIGKEAPFMPNNNYDQGGLPLGLSLT